MSLLLSKPDLLISKEEINGLLGENEKGQHNRIAQSIDRLRKCLAVIPKLKIEAVRGIGYRLKID